MYRIFEIPNFYVIRTKTTEKWFFFLFACLPTYQFSSWTDVPTVIIEIIATLLGKCCQSLIGNLTILPLSLVHYRGKYVCPRLPRL